MLVAYNRDKGQVKKGGKFKVRVLINYQKTKMAGGPVGIGGSLISFIKPSSILGRRN